MAPRGATAHHVRKIQLRVLCAPCKVVMSASQGITLAGLATRPIVATLRGEQSGRATQTVAEGHLRVALTFFLAKPEQYC